MCLRYSLVVLVLSALAGAQAKPANPTDTPAHVPVIDISAMDKSVEPCVNFYQYACGNWIKQNPLPPDRPTFGRFDQLNDNNDLILRSILEKASANDPSRDAVHQKIGDYYASCIDEAAVNAKGAKPLDPELARINAIKTKAELPELLAFLQPLGVNAFFSYGSDQDFHDATQEIAEVDQGGLGLPDRDYYLKDDAKSVELRKAYAEHVRNMLKLTGESAQQAQADADAIMKLETALARGSMDRVARREPANVYHKMQKAQFYALDPAFNWNQYFTGVQSPSVESLNVTAPDFFKALDAVLKTSDLNTIKAYLRWHLAHVDAPYLSSDFVNENFNFYGKSLTGTQQLRPRWKRCVAQVDSVLGEALGQSFVQETFGAEGKQRTLDMVHKLEAALQQDITTLPWMTEATKQQAIVKLHAIANKIGYPDHWRDYSKLRIVRGDELGNAQRGDEFEFHRQLAKIGKPVDRGEWLIPPPIVDAYYSAQMNDINFPAGILQPPFFDKSIDDAANFGAIGAVIGHELTHGFDDQGRKFDAQGNLHDWWTAADAKAFEERTSCLVNEYSSFSPVDDVHLNGKLTLGENTADNGGLRISYMALQSTSEGKPSETIDGMTPDQRFFLAFAQVWCQNQTPEMSRMLAQVDPHSPGQFRVKGTLQNMPEFQKAYACRQGQPMVSAKACRVW